MTKVIVELESPSEGLLPPSTSSKSTQPASTTVTVQVSSDDSGSETDSSEVVLVSREKVGVFL